LSQFILWAQVALAMSVTWLDAQFEVTHLLDHSRVAIARVLLSEQFRIGLCGISHLERQREVTETKVFRWDETSKEDIDSLSDAERQGNDSVGSRQSIKNADEVGKVIQNALMKGRS